LSSVPTSLVTAGSAAHAGAAGLAARTSARMSETSNGIVMRFSYGCVSAVV
jgi:hypothetical protein